jgi:hypothetical protein
MGTEKIRTLLYMKAAVVDELEIQMVDFESAIYGHPS